MPAARHVLPAPSGPASTTRSPGCRRVPSSCPRAVVSAAVGSTTRRSGPHGSRPGHARRRGRRSPRRGRSSDAARPGRRRRRTWVRWVQRRRSSSRAASNSPGCSSIAMCPAPSRGRSSACGISAEISSECSYGIIRSRVPPATSTSHCESPASAARRLWVDSVLANEVSASSGVDGDRLVDQVHQRRVGGAVAERQALHERPDDVAGGPPHAVGEGGLPVRHPTQHVDRRVAVRQHGLLEPAGHDVARRGADQGHARDALLEQLRVALGQRHDRHAAHGVPDQHDRALGDDGAQDRVEVGAELGDRARARATPGRSGRGGAGRRARCAPRAR